MNLTLPPVIQEYIDREGDDTVDRINDCFCADAIVKDEGKSIEGIAAIKNWKQATKLKYQYSVEPLSVQEIGNRVVMSARLTGNFPGSPIVVTYNFVLKDHKIQTLEIG
jgi:hypothetical protein